jgi:SAM-dependent methyltransferase
MVQASLVTVEPAALQRVEITDLLWRCDPDTDRRLPVRAGDVVARLEASGQQRAARLVGSLPERAGILDERAVDALMVRVHCELQRLSEELQLPRRLAETLRSWTGRLLEQCAGSPVRVVDVGCGIGYALRWLAAHDALPTRVELVGVDMNHTLVRHATRLADAERLPCRFVSGDAFAPGIAIDDPTRTIVISTGLLHHLAVEELTNFFAAQQRLRVIAFAHWDLTPSAWATTGAWVFHRARMREAVSRHDGVLSARRAHTAATLLAAADEGAPGYRLACSDPPRWRPPVTDVLRPITGLATR